MDAAKPTRRIAVLAAMSNELAPFVKALDLHPTRIGALRAYSATFGDKEVVATKMGMGTAAARRTIESLLDAGGSFDHVLVIGIAGGIDPGLGIGDLVQPTVVLDGATGEEYRPAPLAVSASSGTLHTSDALILDDTRLDELRGQGVVALDMETAAVAAVCEARSCPWSVVRSISDRPADNMVDKSVLGLAGADGNPNLAAVARYLLRRPWRIGRLVRLGRDAKRSTEASAAAGALACRQL